MSEGRKGILEMRLEELRRHVDGLQAAKNLLSGVLPDERDVGRNFAGGNRLVTITDRHSENASHWLVSLSRQLRRCGSAPDILPAGGSALAEAIEDELDSLVRSHAFPPK